MTSGITQNVPNNERLNSSLTLRWAAELSVGENIHQNNVSNIKLP